MPNHNTYGLRALLIGVWLSVRLAVAAPLPLIDAHSQFDEDITPGKVAQLVREAGVQRVIVAARGEVTAEEIARMQKQYPGCFIPALRTKGRAYDENRKGYYRRLEEQLAMPDFAAMAEILLVHAPKGQKAPEVDVAATAPQAQTAIQAAIERRWPVILHYEFRWLGLSKGADAKARRMQELELLLKKHPQHPFALIHLGQLEADEAARLLATHSNLHLLTSHANNITRSESNQPWSLILDQGKIVPEWMPLVLRHPDRFILAFDNVWPEHWSERYIRQTEQWQLALQQLPDDVAHAIAHRNAERLWKIPPFNGRGCASDNKL